MQNIRLYNEDCLIGMSRIETGTVDMVLCDLPYGTTNCAWDIVISFEPLWEQYRRVVKPNGALVFMAAQPFATDLINSARDLFRYELIWEKSAPVGFHNANRMPLRSHELILVFYKLLPTYHPQGLIKLDKPLTCGRAGKGGAVYHGLDKRYRREFTNYPRSILRFPLREKRAQPTQKPVALFEYLIRTYTNEGELVLDNCMGSGTAALACMRTGRRFIGFEKDCGHFQTAQNRVAGESNVKL